MIFAVVMLAALAVGAYALLESRTAKATATEQGCGGDCSTPCCGN